MGSKVFKYIRDEEERQAHNIELIACQRLFAQGRPRLDGSRRYKDDL